VVVRQKGADIRSASNRRLGGGRLVPADSFAGSGTPYLWAMSAAEVYFRRPAHAPTRIEYPSLFSPYWQVRLVEPTTLQRAAAHAYAQ
jgi:hypothetical protein